MDERDRLRDFDLPALIDQIKLGIKDLLKKHGVESLTTTLFGKNQTGRPSGNPKTAEDQILGSGRVQPESDKQGDIIASSKEVHKKKLANIQRGTASRLSPPTADPTNPE